MASRLFSQILPPAATQSVYEAIEDHERAAQASDDGDDDESRVQATLDEQNLVERFRDEDIDGLLADAADSHITTQSPEMQAASPRSVSRHPSNKASSTTRPKWLEESMMRHPSANEDDVAPEYLLLDDPTAHNEGRQPSPDPRLPSPVPGPSNKRSKVQWNTHAEDTRLYSDAPRLPSQRGAPVGPLYIADSAEKARYRWANVENLDNFLSEVYDYYVQKGIWSICLARLLTTLTMGFVIAFSTFLVSCVDYSRLHGSTRLDDVLVPKCTQKMSSSMNVFLWLASFAWVYKLALFMLGTRRLWHMHEFYRHLLDIPDSEIQTISWQEIVGRLMTLRESNPRTALNLTAQNRKFIGERAKQRMDAHDIANRIMRMENYMIALINKDMLNITIPLPFLRNRKIFSRILEWSIQLSVMDYAFNQKGQVNQLFLKDKDRKALIEALQRRFILTGFLMFMFAPFGLVFFTLTYFMRYFTEFNKNPSQIGSRAYTPIAEWKFREFNELPHLFRQRINMSYPPASLYLDQFPKDKTIQLARFVAFISGALAAVLGVATLIDGDFFLNFQITTDRTAFFYLSVLTGLWAVTRGMVPEDSHVFNPEYAINEVINFTHFKPAHWDNRLHSDDVRKEFSEMYQVKIVTFAEEVMSIILTPFILWFSLPESSERIVDFFREFTVHVDGLGYVCSFAHFNFQKPGVAQAPADPKRSQAGHAGLRDDYYATKDNKMLASYYSFLDSYAHNPRRGDHHAPKRNFRPPPAFPGLASPPQMPQSGNRRSAATEMPLGARSMRQASNNRVGAAMSPSPSLLLDPHNQPSMTLSRRTGRQMTSMGQSRYRPQRRPVEEDRDSEVAEQASGDPTLSVLVDEDSHLGDSWKAGQVGVDSNETARDERRDSNADAGGGVLGLLYQFQKAQTERAGVNI